MPAQSFARRFGFAGEPIIDAFPEEARVALAYLFDDMVRETYIADWDDIVREIGRLGVVPVVEPGSTKRVVHVASLLEPLEWHRVYALCEGIYRRSLQEPGYWDHGYGLDEDLGWKTTGTIEESREYYQQRLNELLEEHNLGYTFEEGQFHRRGHLQTQKAMARAGAVLSQPRLDRVRVHFNKARRFFDQRPQPDSENAVKEAVCALEACLEIVTGTTASGDFDKLIRQLQGNGPEDIPPTIGEIMIKLRAYRGAAQGVAHAALQGSKVGEPEAEIVLSLVASCITYLADLYPK